MTTERINISRTEFYSALTIIWVYIQCVIHKSYIQPPNNPNWFDYALFVGAFLQVIGCATIGFWVMFRSFAKPAEA